jgi:hypothetical protein
MFALYHRPFLPPQRLIIAAEKDGLADLANTDGVLVVTSCIISDTPKEGECSREQVTESEPEQSKPQPKPKRK